MSFVLGTTIGGARLGCSGHCLATRQRIRCDEKASPPLRSTVRSPN
jgi:hypothetical protein